MDNWYDELMRRILDVQEEMLKCEAEANTVVLNGRKYGKLFKDGFRPTIFGLKAEVADLPDNLDFLVQYVEPEPLTNADRIRAMSDEELAEYLNNVETIGGHLPVWGKSAWLDWLRSEAKEEDDGRKDI